MTIKIEFTTGQDAQHDEQDAAALFAFLVTRYPNAAETALAALSVEQTVTGGPDAFTLKAFAGLEPDAPPIERTKVVIPSAAFVHKSGEAGAIYTEPTVMPAEAGAPLPDVTDPKPLTPEQAFGQAAPASSATAPASATVAVPAEPATATASSDLDAEGLPWDARIHSSNHKRSANGVWMKRRGVNQLVEHQVRAELRQTYPAPASPAERTMQAVVAEGLIPSPPASAASVPPPPVATQPVVPPPPAATSATPQPTASASTPDNGANTGSSVPAPPTASPSDAAPVINGPAEFQRVMVLLAGPTGLQQTGRITLDQTNAIITGMGLTAISDLLKQPQRIAEFEQKVLELAGAA